MLEVFDVRYFGVRSKTNSKTFEANLQNSRRRRVLQNPTGHPEESNGRPLDQTSRPIYDCIVTFLTINCCHSI